MKYAIVILGGAADQPQPPLDGQTPLQHADAPTLAQLAAVGRLGEVQLIPPDANPPVPPGADAALLALLGYKPDQRYPGHAPLHALGAALPIAEGDACFELSLLSVIDGVAQPTSALNIPDGEAETLIRGLLAEVDLPGAVVHPGQPTRLGTPAHLLIDPASTGRDWAEVVTLRPDDIAGTPLRKAMPVGGAAGDRLCRFIEASAAHLADHELNHVRAEMGEPAITHLWPWGQGTLPPGGKPVKPWIERFGKSAVVISPDPAVRGVATLAGLQATSPQPEEDAPPAEGDELRASLLRLADCAAEAIEQHDLVIVHTDAPRHAAIEAGPADKAQAIELADTCLLGPVYRALATADEQHRLLVTPLHTTQLATRREAADPVPFLIAGHKITNVVPRPMTEPAMAEADLKVAFGHELMEFLLRSGIR